MSTAGTNDESTDADLPAARCLTSPGVRTVQPRRSRYCSPLVDGTSGDGWQHSERRDAAEAPRWIAFAMFAAVAVVLYLVVAAAFGRYAHLYSFGDERNHPGRDPIFTGPRWLAGWVRYDALWYRGIALDGYFFRGKSAQSSVAFFPLYPLILRLLHRCFGGDPATWGVPVTFTSGRWARSR